MSHTNWMHNSRRITQCRRKSPAFATHSSGEHLLLFHGPIVAVHHSVTGIPHCRPSAPNFLQLTVFRVSKTVDELPAPPVSTQLAIPLSHSLCNVVSGQHSQRKPRHGAGRLSTTPDKRDWVELIIVSAASCLQLLSVGRWPTVRRCIFARSAAFCWRLIHLNRTFMK